MRNRVLLASSVALAAPYIGHLAAYGHDNTLTRLIPDLFESVDVVSRELVGMIPSVYRNASAERAAVGESIVYPIAPVMAAVDIVPSMTTPEPPGITEDNGVMTISKSRAVPFGWTGEEQRGLNNGIGVRTIQQGWFEQGLRTLTNEIENDLVVEGAVNASRAWGTAGTTPFATNVGDSAQVRKLLDDNGAPPSFRSLVGDTSMGAALRTLGQLTKANEAGTIMTLRDGQLLDLNGLSIKESAQVKQSVPGTAAGVVTTAAGFPVGTTAIAYAAGGTGALKKGDIVTFAGDSNKYVVAVAVANVAAAGTLTIAKPGLQKAIPAAGTAVTVGGAFTANIGFSQNAIHLIARAPALPNGTDNAIDSTMLVDPRSGIAFELRLYAGYRKIRAEVGLAWGFKANKPEHIVLLLG